MHAAHPIFTCEEAKQYEAVWFAGDEEREWAAMQRAGRAVAGALLKDFQELGGFPSEGNVLVLAGKGHNAGDALIAARHIGQRHPKIRIEVVLVMGECVLRPLAMRAWRELQSVAAVCSTPMRTDYDLVIDGVFGFQFRPPLAPAISKLFGIVNALSVGLRAAVDVPSGLDAPDAFRADFTYATGSLKVPLLAMSNAGRLRYVDLGLFEGAGAALVLADDRRTEWVTTEAVLAPLRTWRAPQSDKRSYGHVIILGGSRRYPGAVLMSVQAALCSGVGLVTACVPETFVAAFAASVPEAMWVGWPETPEGGLALEGGHLLREVAARGTALLVGPGVGRERETLTLIQNIVAESALPVVIDADALQSEIVAAGEVPRILTPHAGEYQRIAMSVPARATLVRKGPLTIVQSGGNRFYNVTGGPVLARGGSGDVLAGMIAGLLAQTPTDPLGAARRGVFWHGAAADGLARAHGQIAVTTTQLLDFLPAGLRGARVNEID